MQILGEKSFYKPDFRHHEDSVFWTGLRNLVMVFHFSKGFQSNLVNVYVKNGIAYKKKSIYTIGESSIKKCIS